MTDITIRHPTTPTAMNVVHPKIGAVLADAFKRKTRQYKELARSEGARLVPLAISAFGHFHKKHLLFLKRLSWEALNNGVVHDERERRAFYKQAVREIAVLLGKMNAKIFIRGLRDSRFRRWNMARSIRAAG